MRDTKTSKPKRSHSFSGCKACRRRHLKCDQTAPRCKRCRVSGLACDFTPTLSWVVSTGQDVDEKQTTTERSANHFSRRFLYSEDARKSQSCALVATIPSTVNEALDEIDDESKIIQSHQVLTREVGPFGVFNVEGSNTVQGISTATRPARITQDDSSSRTSIDKTVNKISPILEEPSIDPSIDPVLASKPFDSIQNYQDNFSFGFNDPGILEDFFSSPLDTLQWGDLFTWDFDPSQQTSFHYSDPIASATGPDVPSRTEWRVNDADASLQEINHDQGLPFELDSLSWPKLDMDVDAPLLLKHFDDKVIDQMGSLPVNEKSPWRILNYPSAIMTFTQLAVLKIDRHTIKHACLSNFYALIAVSAFHLSLNPIHSPQTDGPGHHWASVSMATYEAAKYHLSVSLLTESKPPNKGKYKVQLMAIAAILTTSFLSGNTTDARRYLAEMEQLIRSRGVTKVVISRRARLLHNIYAWMRILSESTRVFHEEIPAITLLNVSPNVESTEARQQRLDDFLELEPHKTRGGSGTGSREAPGSSAVDIHMETSHQDLDNLHMQIYGVPETWLRLVSQITRLSNVLDQLSPNHKRSDAELLVSLQPKASYLEDAVCLFKSRHSIEINNSNAAADEMTPHPYMLQALSSALVIFYYRRIKNVNPLVLQDSVNNVIHCLQKFDNALAQRELLGPGTAWPAFIAGAEATGGEQQQQIITWLDNASRKSHWKGYESSKKILEEVWRERAMAGGSQSPTWIDICRRSRQWPLLC